MITLRADTIAGRLSDLGIVTTQQLEQARQEALATQERMSVILVRRGLLRDPDASKRLAMQLGAMPQRLQPPLSVSAAAGRMPAQLCQTHRVAPVGETGGRVLLATDDPLSIFSQELFTRQCGAPVDLVLVREEEFTQALAGLAGAPSTAAAAPAPTLTPSPAPPARPTPAPGRVPATAPPAPKPSMPPVPAAAPSKAEGDEPIIRLVDSMLADAVRLRASDVHLQPETEQLRLRYRVDGVLRDANSPPKGLQGSITSRLKIMAGLNIAEKRLPQDGRLQLTVEGRTLDVRVSTLPASHGESIVMRLLDRSQPLRGLAEMGMAAEDQAVWDELIHRPHGAVLVTGPTGSGKTTTLYGALSVLNQADRKLITVEDPVEYQLPGVNQVAVRPIVGLTFAAGLRSMLRQAPDVIMVGEIRDQETAQIAIQAALTGHVVLTTLHTNDAPSAITRLIDMGVAPFLVASTVQGVLAQRLVRRLCESCRRPEPPSPEERAFLGPPEPETIMRAPGCDRCQGSGFAGRVGLFELLVVTDAVRALIVSKAPASAIRKVGVEAGMRSLTQDGRAKIRAGVTTLAEVLRVAADFGQPGGADGLA